MFVTILERLGQLVLAFIYGYIRVEWVCKGISNPSVRREDEEVKVWQYGERPAFFTLPRDSVRTQPLRAAKVSSPTCADNHKPRTTHMLMI